MQGSWLRMKRHLVHRYSALHAKERNPRVRPSGSSPRNGMSVVGTEGPCPHGLREVKVFLPEHTVERQISFHNQSVIRFVLF